jgi:hypothetical protein
MAQLKFVKVSNKKHLDELAAVFGSAEAVPEFAKFMYKKNDKGCEKAELKEDRHEFTIARELHSAQHKEEARARMMPSAKKAKKPEVGIEAGAHPTPMTFPPQRPPTTFTNIHLHRLEPQPQTK